MQRITDINEIQAILNGILLHFSQICKKHGLRFYLANGTLLGAVKYQGFIPWDDDIDILMPREDYDKFVRLDDVDTMDYLLLSMERISGWKVPYAKLSDRHTILQETTANFGHEMGVSIDIFPMDCWRGRKCCAVLQASYCGWLRRFMSASMEESFYSPRTGMRRGILYCIWKFSRYMGADFFRKLILHETRDKKAESSLIGSVSWAPYGRKEVMEASFFAETVSVQFEKNLYPAPIGYEYYLRNLYGEWECELPVQKQKTHHTFLIWRKDEN